MTEILQTVLAYLRGMWHRRWIGIGAAWLAAAIGVAVVMNIPQRYEASARLFVDTQSLLRPLMAGISIQPNLDQQVVLLSRTLVSRPNIEKLVRMTDLDLAASGASAEEVIDTVMRRIQLSGTPNSNLYNISYKDPDKERARKVVQSLVTIFVESSLGNKREDTTTAVKFIDEQIERYEAGLKTAEDRLKDFRLKYLGVSGAGTQNFYARLNALNDQIANAKLALRGAEEARDSYKRELAGEVPVLIPQVGASPAQAAAAQVGVPAIDARLATLRSDLDTLLRKYTDGHPDVVGTRRIIAQLEEQRSAEMAKIAAATPGTPGAPAEPPPERNPVYQQLKVALASAEANLASMRATLSSLENQQQRLVASARLVPEVEAELTQLNRDYNTQKKTYEALLARRESASLGEGVSDAGGTRFRVIDPPRVAPQPVFPSRLVLLGVVLLIAVMTGLAASLVAHQAMPIVHDARSLSAVAKRPVIGIVTVFPSAAMRRMRRLYNVLFAGAAGGFVAAFAAMFAFVFFIGRVV